MSDFLLCVRLLVDKWAGTGKGATVEFTGNRRSVERKKSKIKDHNFMAQGDQRLLLELLDSY